MYPAFQHRHFPTLKFRKKLFRNSTMTAKAKHICPKRSLGMFTEEDVTECATGG
jgi:hypothetical protein